MARRLLFAPDSYGGFLAAPASCAVLEGRLGWGPERLALHPMSDGGEGLLLALAWHRPLRLRTIRVTGPYGEAAVAGWGWMDEVAVIESAAAIGLALTGERAPRYATSAGLGELVRAVAARTEQPLWIGLGGSATVDAGLGLAGALGLRAEDATGRALPSPLVAEDLARVHRLVGDPPLPGRPVRAGADVHTPLREATARFGLQKGLRPEEVPVLSELLDRWADILDRWRAEAGRSPISRDLEGGGAAGGLGYALAALLDAPLESGARVFAELSGLDQALDGCDLVVLGEGRLDASSLMGKVAGEVLTRARRRGLPVAALVGSNRGAPGAPRGPDRVFVAGESPSRAAAFLSAIDALGAWFSEGG